MSKLLLPISRCLCHLCKPACLLPLFFSPCPFPSLHACPPLSISSLLLPCPSLFLRFYTSLLHPLHPAICSHSATQVAVQEQRGPALHVDVLRHEPDTSQRQIRDTTFITGETQRKRSRGGGRGFNGLFCCSLRQKADSVMYGHHRGRQKPTENTTLPNTLLGSSKGRKGCGLGGNHRSITAVVAFTGKFCLTNCAACATQSVFFQPHNCRAMK